MNATLRRTRPFWQPRRAMIQTLRIGLEWFINPDHVPLFIAREKGWLAQGDVALELVEPAAHLDAFAAIRAGELDLAVTEPIHLVADLAHGDDVVGFARFLHTHGGVMYLGGRGIERPRDMAGKRGQYPGAPGLGCLAIVRSMIEADGGDPSAALTPVNHGFKHTDALLEDRADLATLVFHNFEILEARSRGADARLFDLASWGVPDFCQLILISSPERLSQKRAAVEVLLRAMRRAIMLVRESPDEARALYSKATGQDVEAGLGRAIFDATVACFTFDFDMSEAYYAQLARWMKQTGQIEAVPRVSAAWTSSFLGP